MAESVHGHEVLHMMLENSEGFTTQSLIEAIVARFGEEARFHTCSAQGMNAVELVAFLESKGKFVPQGEGFNTEAERICNH